VGGQHDNTSLEGKLSGWEMDSCTTLVKPSESATTELVSSISLISLSVFKPTAHSCLKKLAVVTHEQNVADGK